MRNKRLGNLNVAITKLRTLTGQLTAHLESNTVIIRSVEAVLNEIDMNHSGNAPRKSRLYKEAPADLQAAYETNLLFAKQFLDHLVTASDALNTYGKAVSGEKVRIIEDLKDDIRQAGSRLYALSQREEQHPALAA